MRRQTGLRDERLIGALIPPSIPRRQPDPVRLPALPSRRVPAEVDRVALAVSRMDRSGRLSARSLLPALGWRSGHQLDIAVVRDTVVLVSARTGQHAVGARGCLMLPAAARALCGLRADQPVLLAAYPDLHLMVVHPAAAVAALLTPTQPPRRRAGPCRLTRTASPPRGLS
jgi:hypothetical protein